MIILVENTDYDYKDLDNKAKDKYEKKLKKQNGNSDDNNKKIKLDDNRNKNNGKRGAVAKIFFVIANIKIFNYFLRF